MRLKVVIRKSLFEINPQSWQGNKFIYLARIARLSKKSRFEETASLIFFGVCRLGQVMLKIFPRINSGISLHVQVR